ncbi:cell wall hydrolase [Acetobacter sp. AN02]|uniref:hypothetical protein n=1 Tax=Acetobacter sp. AN02 TaxID=2894186 RepID=UPI0024343675|nr:hypothetical protein [Acetobacter sp. AN02]MDG6094280.1 cell wall hydrolase [Acetobacter sp. AN02]
MAQAAGAGPVRPPEATGAAASGSEDIATLPNINDLAAVISAESKGLIDSHPNAPFAVGWTLKNRMRRNGISSVRQAWRGYAHSGRLDNRTLAIAHSILEGTTPDPTDGATHFYTPQIMPKEGESTSGADVGGGLELVPGVTG